MPTGTWSLSPTRWGFAGIFWLRWRLRLRPRDRLRRPGPQRLLADGGRRSDDRTHRQPGCQLRLHELHRRRLRGLKPVHGDDGRRQVGGRVSTGTERCPTFRNRKVHQQALGASTVSDRPESGSHAKGAAPVQPEPAVPAHGKRHPARPFQATMAIRGCLSWCQLPSLPFFALGYAAFAVAVGLTSSAPAFTRREHLGT